jgi:hypothetical protein
MERLGVRLQGDNALEVVQAEHLQRGTTTPSVRHPASTRPTSPTVHHTHEHHCQGGSGVPSVCLHLRSNGRSQRSDLLR